MPRERRNASVQARMQINPSASWVISENKGPSVRWPRVAITMACPATRMQEAPTRADESRRGGIGRAVRVEFTLMGQRVSQWLGRATPTGLWQLDGQSHVRG